MCRLEAKAKPTIIATVKAFVAATELAGMDAVGTTGMEGSSSATTAFVTNDHFGCSDQMWSSGCGCPSIWNQVCFHS